MENREEIRSRMLRDVARIWGFQDTEMDEKAFDPVVGLLVGACATEFDKLRQEMSNSRQRILDRLLTTLTPDVLTAALPAHAVMHARSIEPESEIQPGHQVYFRKKNGKEEKEIYFSPAGRYRIFNANMQYLATPGKIFQLDELLTRSVAAQSELYRNQQTAPVLWLGIKAHSKLTSLKGFTFFFNWKNEPRVYDLLRQLSYCKCWVGAQELGFVRGIPDYEITSREERYGTFESEFSPLWRAKRRAQEYYESHFITITGDNQGRDLPLEGLLKTYPGEFESLFPLEDLMRFTDKLLWLKVEFPEYFPPAALATVECLLNCVPVLNLRLNSETHRLPELMNIIPLPCDDFFFDVERVSNEQGQEMRANPLAHARNLAAGTYTLRNRGIGKLDSRAASRHLYHLLDLLRDESAAFSAYNLNYLEGQIRKINQDISDLEQRVAENDVLREDIPFLIVRPLPKERNNQVKVEYWSTNGVEANDIPSGVALEMFATRGFDRESLMLVTRTTGGANNKTPSEAFFEFKKALTTRDRIITKEDIKTFAFARLGGRIQQAEVQKGFRVSDAPGEGMTRTLDVLLQLNPAENDGESAETASLCRELEIELNNKSSGLLPIQVRIV